MRWNSKQAERPKGKGSVQWNADNHKDEMAGGGKSGHAHSRDLPSVHPPLVRYSLMGAKRPGSPLPVAPPKR